MNPISKRAMSIGLAGLLGLGVLGGASLAVASDEGASVAERVGLRHHRGAVVGAHQLIKAAGLDPEVVKQGVKSGQTLEQIFQANGVDSDAVVAEVLADVDAKLATAVANGKLSADQAATARERAEAALDKALTAQPGTHAKHHIARNAIEHAAEAIGIAPKDLVGELKTGKSIADVAGEHNVPVETVVDAIVAPAEERIEQAVASGRISEARGDELLSKARDRAAELVTKSREPRAR